MKKAIKYISIHIMLLAVAYGCAVYLSFEVNPLKWDKYGRAAVVAVFIIITWLPYSYWAMCDNKKTNQHGLNS